MAEKKRKSSSSKKAKRDVKDLKPKPAKARMVRGGRRVISPDM